MWKEVAGLVTVGAGLALIRMNTSSAPAAAQQQTSDTATTDTTTTVDQTAPDPQSVANTVTQFTGGAQAAYLTTNLAVTAVPIIGEIALVGDATSMANQAIIGRTTLATDAAIQGSTLMSDNAKFDAAAATVQSGLNQAAVALAGGKTSGPEYAAAKGFTDGLASLANAPTHLVQFLDTAFSAIPIEITKSLIADAAAYAVDGQLLLQTAPEQIRVAPSARLGTQAQIDGVNAQKQRYSDMLAAAQALPPSPSVQTQIDNLNAMIAACDTALHLIDDNFAKQQAYLDAQAAAAAKQAAQDAANESAAIDLNQQALAAAASGNQAAAQQLMDQAVATLAKTKGDGVYVMGMKNGGAVLQNKKGVAVLKPLPAPPPPPPPPVPPPPPPEPWTPPREYGQTQATPQVGTPAQQAEMKNLVSWVNSGRGRRA